LFGKGGQAKGAFKGAGHKLGSAPTQVNRLHLFVICCKPRACKPALAASPARV
jgi:hypothetical protein